MKGDREKCLEAGASDYVSKPVDIDQLLAVLRVQLERSEHPVTNGQGRAAERRRHRGASGRPDDARHVSPAASADPVTVPATACRCASGRSRRRSSSSTTIRATSSPSRRCCGQPGIEIVLAESGEEALRHVLKDDFAVILLDVQMPRIDGYEVADHDPRRGRARRACRSSS